MPHLPMSHQRTGQKMWCPITLAVPLLRIIRLIIPRSWSRSTDRYSTAFRRPCSRMSYQRLRLPGTELALSSVSTENKSTDRIRGTRALLRSKEIFCSRRSLGWGPTGPRKVQRPRPRLELGDVDGIIKKIRKANENRLSAVSKL